MGTSGWLLLAALVVLLACSALISGSEVAFFSITAADQEDLEKPTHPNNGKIQELIQEPDQLLATILISNNFVNVGIVIVATYLINLVQAGDQWSSWVVFVVEILGITAVLLLFGEILPKVYANAQRLTFARFMATPLSVLNRAMEPLSKRLSSAVKRLQTDTLKTATISVDDLEQALELTDEGGSQEEKRILQGIVRFGSTSVKEVMTPRTSVVAVERGINYHELLEILTSNSYSRVPVFVDHFDQIEGLIYIKDLLPYAEASESFAWQDLIRNPFYVPETKKIDDLLKEFQHRRIHLAVVVDEFGGTSGVISLEDVIEEIVGEISDEFDDDDLTYSKLDKNTYVFEAKTPLIDFCRVLGIGKERFESIGTDIDTLAGLVLELYGKFPDIDEQIEFEEFTFKTESVEARRILRIKVCINPDHSA